MTEYAGLSTDSANDLFTLGTASNSGNIRLMVTPSITNSDNDFRIKVTRSTKINIKQTIKRGELDMAIYNKEFSVKNGLVVENNNSVKLSTSTGVLRYVSIKALPTSLTGDYTLTFPGDDGAADEMLITDGSGNLSWGKVNTINMFPNSVTPVVVEDTGDFTMNSLLATKVSSPADMVLDPNNDDGVTGVVEIKGDLVVRGNNNIMAGAKFCCRNTRFYCTGCR